MCWNRFQSRWTLWSRYLLGCPASRFIKPSPCTLRAWCCISTSCCQIAQGLADQAVILPVIKTPITWRYFWAIYCEMKKKGNKYVYNCICLLHIIFIGGNLEKLPNSDVPNSSFCIVGSEFSFHVFITCTFYSFQRAGIGLRLCIQHSIAG